MGDVIFGAIQRLLENQPGAGQFRRSRTPVNILQEKPESLRARLGTSLAGIGRASDETGYTMGTQGSMIFPEANPTELADTLRHEEAHALANQGGGLTYDENERLAKYAGYGGEKGVYYRKAAEAALRKIQKPEKREAIMNLLTRGR